MSSRKEEKQQLAKKFALGAVLSAAVGYLTGLLTAPKSGKATREAIKDRAAETYNTAEKELKKLHTELNDVISEASDRIDSFRNKKEVGEFLDKGRDAKQKAREVLSALHDGEAEDKDLQKAIKDATAAIEHLRTYLHK